MARLASVVKQGYFPAPPEAVAGILRHLKIPDPPPDCRFKAEDVNILDPGPDPKKRRHRMHGWLT